MIITLLSGLSSHSQLGVKTGYSLEILEEPRQALTSLVESAKLFDLKVFEYLQYVFNQIGDAKTPRDYERLTPQFAQEHLPKLKTHSEIREKDEPSKNS